MSSEIWLRLNSRECSLFHEVLATYSGGDAANPEAITLARKIAKATPHPNITVGVYGGQVQWTSGNPFPIRIVDYDGDKSDLPGIDENGQRCRVWFEPPDKEQEENLRKTAI